MEQPRKLSRERCIEAWFTLDEEKYRPYAGDVRYPVVR